MFCHNFNLLRVIRNCHHNSWVYLCEKNPKVIINYRNKDLIFVNGKLVDFISWDLLRDLVDDLFFILVNIIENDRIKKIPHIYDPAGEHFYND